jgi:hypothetical protein
MMPRLQLSLKQSNAIRRVICGIEQSIKNRLGLRNTFGDKIIIVDEVLVYEGEKLLFKSKGHIVNQGLVDIINFFSAALTAGNTALPTYGWTTIGNGRMRVGTGTGVTVGTMTSLVTEVATNPNTQSGATSNPSAGIYRVAWIATWNAGTLSAITVTELGLYLNLSTALQAFAGTQPAGSAFTLFSRLSSSDGDFSSFVVNTAVPLTIEWRLTFTFA